MSEFFRHFVFAEPWWLLLLAVIPLLCFLGYRQGVNNYLIFPTLRVLGTLGAKPKNRTWRIKPLLLPLALIPAILAMARPQWQRHFETRTASGIDIIIALDTSGSMQAQDFVAVDGQQMRAIMRIDAAKRVISEFVKGRPDDRIGLVSFAQRPYTASALTLDHKILNEKLFDLDLVQKEDEQGTAIGSAIAASATRLEQLQESKSKVIVLVSDGNNNSGRLTPIEAAELAGELGVKIYPIAIGTEDGKLPNGRQVASPQWFDVETLQKISEITGGEYYRATKFSGLEDAFKTINDLEKTEVERERWTKSNELFHWFAGASVAFIMILLALSAVNPPPLP